MKMAMLNIVLALLWCFVWGSFNFWTLGAGFVLGYFLLGVYSRIMQTEDYGRKALHLFSFGVYFFRILIQANIVIAIAVLRPNPGLAPRIVRYNIDGMNDLQITSLANSITLTPGTLSIDVSTDRKFLYVHCMFARDRDAAIREIDELRHRIMKELF
jgi:multicomponent Na+:H+ antiporter subunit E